MLIYYTSKFNVMEQYCYYATTYMTVHTAFYLQYYWYVTINSTAGM